MSALTDAHANGDCANPCDLCHAEDAYGYVCRSCQRIVRPDEEPSPGEPVRCADCYSDLLREGWGDW